LELLSGWIPALRSCSRYSLHPSLHLPKEEEVVKIYFPEL
jgi:hypothetical protein